MASISSRTKATAAGLLLLLLALSLGLKLTLTGRYRTPDEARLLSDIVARFHRHGFDTFIIDRRYQGDIVIGRRGRCLVAARYGDFGSTLDAEFRQNAAPIGSLHYSYGGALTERPPRLRPTLTLSAQFILSRIGIGIDREPVIAVAGSPGCATPPDLFSSLRLHLMPAAR